MTIQWRPRERNSLRAGAGGALRSHRWQHWLGWAMGIWLLIWALAYAFIPLIVKSQLQRVGLEKLGRQVSVGAVDFKPWSLELTLHELSISRAAPAQAAGQSAQLHIKRIYIDLELQSLLRLAPVADAVIVNEPVASLTHLGQGRYDIDDILARFDSPGPQAGGRGARFALYNLVVSGGQLDVQDEAVHVRHSLQDLRLAVPFLSNLPSQREIKTAPHLAFTLNGSRFNTAAVSTPFAPNRQTDATFTLRNFDLQPYLAYLPASLPFRLQGGVLQADIKLAFEQTPAPSLRISGMLTAAKLRLAEAGRPAAPGAGADLLAIDTLQVALDEIRPLEQVVKLARVDIGAPRLSLARDQAGRLNLLPTDRSNATKKIADKTESKGTTSRKDPRHQSATPARPWQIEIASLGVKDGALSWRDDALAAPMRIRLTDLALNASGIAYPFSPKAPFQFSGLLGLEPAQNTRSAPGTARPVPARLTFEGSASDQSVDVTAQAAAWPVGMAAAYTRQWLAPALTGRLDADLQLTWRAALAGRPAVMRLGAPAVTVSELQLAENGVFLAGAQTAQLQKMDIDLAGRSFKAASLRLSQPKARVERDARGRWMYQRWLAQPKPPAVAAAVAPPVLMPGAAPPWALTIGEVLLDGGAVSFADLAGAEPVAFNITAANVRLGGLALGGSRAVNLAKAPAAPPAAPVMTLAASLQLATGRSKPGSLDFRGSLGLAPLALTGQLTAEQLPAQAFKSYFAGAVNIDLLRADASFNGRVVYRQSAAGAQAEIAGDAALEMFSANTLAPAEELLAWKALKVRGLKVLLDPARATRVDVAEAALTDFFARLIVTPAGRINLQDLLKPLGPNAMKDIAADQGPTNTKSQKESRNPGAAALLAVVNVGPISLVNGQVRFSDRFITPNYSANLSELNGRLGGFSSATPGAAVAPVMADLELRGKAEGTASLEIAGKLNPLVTPLALDITGRVRDLELPPLSPYAIKYAGYGIERGKMSVDVNYVIKPDGQLTARNKLVLNQLSFGDKAENSAASLPVKLAVALLADRNGVIDLDLPISGLLNDPQFSLAPVIGKVILNVIGRAITAPFSLLVRALGGSSGSGNELATVSFAAGSAQLTSAARAGLDKVATALADRPGLQLTVTGASSLEAERDAFQRAQLAERMRAEKQRQQAGKDAGAAVVAAEPAAATADDYPALLKALYQQSDLPRPRNLLGLPKDPPVGDMEKLLLASIAASSDELRELAVRRAQAVKDYLVSRDLPPARLRLGVSQAALPSPQWTPHAELNLAMP